MSSEREQLRELHDAYVWEVNAAIGQDRMDLVWHLADDYLDQALRLISDAAEAGCGRTDCAVCSSKQAMPPVRPRQRWHRRHGGAA